jgi:RsiW-degrading membrane proteinase PrsW (M82 family)
MGLTDRLLALAGVLPPFVLLWLAESFERRVREPTQGYRYRVLAASALSSVPVVWIERLLTKLLGGGAEPQATLVEAFVLSATVEELAKFACLVLLTRGALAPRTRYGAFLYALHAAMGFALVENVLAMLRVPDLIAFSTRFYLRAYLTVPMHLLAGGALGYLWARRHFDGRRVGLPGGIAIAIAIHGVYNACVLAVERLPDEAHLAQTASATVAFAIPLFGLVLLRLMAGELRAIDARAIPARPGRRAADGSADQAINSER